MRQLSPASPILALFSAACCCLQQQASASFAFHEPQNRDHRTDVGFLLDPFSSSRRQKSGRNNSFRKLQKQYYSPNQHGNNAETTTTTHLFRLFATASSNDDREYDYGGGDDELVGDGLLAMEASVRGEEKSRLPDYVTQYLGRQLSNELQQDDDVATGSVGQNCTNDGKEQFSLHDDVSMATHLIAIPMESCDELMLELESVQRVILSHCPILLDACIPAASTRLPLLYVQHPPTTDRLRPMSTATDSLTDTVRTLVHKHIFQNEVRRESVSNDSDDDASDNDDDEDTYLSGKYRPLTMTFKSLEIDGENNNRLYTVGQETVIDQDGDDNDEDMFEGATTMTRLENFVLDLKTVLDAKGWMTSFPPDVPNGSSGSENSPSFRPRVAFMELPQGFDDNISNFRRPETPIGNADMKFLTSDEGGNGISPIFWSEWWDDVFAKNTRLREVAIYAQTPQFQEGDKKDPSFLKICSQFRMPYEVIPLPEGDSSTMKRERKFQEYQGKRIQEEQEKVYGGLSGDFNVPSRQDDRPRNPDILMSKTREQLEKIYTNSADDDNSQMKDAIEEIVDDSYDDATNDNERIGANGSTTSENDYMADWMKERIKIAVESLESVKSKQPTKSELQPPIEDNPVFKAYKDGNLVPKSKKTTPKPKQLSVYPGTDHFVGAWKVLTKPVGFKGGDSTYDASDNMILRIDGTTAGGPTLDIETNQRAAGGTWKIWEEENGKVRLRIRLAIPPKKQRIVVLEGYVIRVGSQVNVPMASAAFGIPHLDPMAGGGGKDVAELLTCSGDVYIEDAITKENRQYFGEFSLTKINMKTDQYTITIPNVRIQD